MRSSLIFIFALLAIVNGGILIPSTKILQGPSNRALVIGPDGSAISTFTPGGAVISDQNPGFITAHATPVIVEGVTTYTAPLNTFYTTYSTPLVHNTVIAGPSGTISTGNHH